MHAVLFQAIESARSRDWTNFRRIAQLSVKETARCQRLADSVWLITEDDPWMSLAQLLELSRKNAIAARTLEFDLESQWQDHHSPV